MPNRVRSADMLLLLYQKSGSDMLKKHLVCHAVSVGGFI